MRTISEDVLRQALASIERIDREVQTIQRSIRVIDGNLPAFAPRYIRKRVEAREALSTGLTAEALILDLPAGCMVSGAFAQCTEAFAGPSLSSATAVLYATGDFIEEATMTPFSLTTSPLDPSLMHQPWRLITTGPATLALGFVLIGCTWDSLTAGDMVVHVNVATPGEYNASLPRV